jgi:hypothetical protein
MAQKLLSAAALCLLVVSTSVIAQQQAHPAVITSVSQSGVGYVTYSSSSTGLDAEIGRWDTPYPNGDNGQYAPGLEPTGASVLLIDVDVNDGGIASFGYKLKTWDAGIWDWYDISVQTPAGIVSIVNHLGKPGSDYGTYFESAQIPISFKMTPYINQHLTFIFSVQQDGWGDQTAGDVFGFGLRTCPVAPLTQITDPAALAFENGNTVDTADLTADMQTALDCVEQAVGAAGGTVTVNSAYRPSSYQEHLREVWDKWRLLVDRREAECADLRTQVQQEFQRHGLLLAQRPASPNGPHTQGLAVDMRSSLPLQQFLNLANGCQLYRPLPQNDPVHFIHQ